MIRLGSSRLVALSCLSVVASALSWVSSASAQPTPAPMPPGPVAPAVAAPAPVAPAAPVASGAAAPVTPPPAAPATDFGVQGGALTADIVGRRAAETSFTAKAAEENVRAAAAKVDQAWASFLPRLTGKASYTRLSDFTPPSATGGGAIVGTTAAPGTPNPAPTFAVGFSFPIVVNQWSLEAQIVVPISDYFLRINQAYSAATKSQEAARLDVVTARARASSDGKLAFYNWLRARGSSVVAKQSLEQAKTHLQDARNQLSVGNASRADVLRAETAVAGAELAVERTKNLIALTQRQIGVAIHSREDEELAPGEGIEADPTPFVGSLPQLVAEAKSQRYEIRSIDVNAEAARKQIAAVRGGAYPSLSAFGSAIYADPNPRRFPQVDANGKTEWFGTWALGGQITWSPNDTVTALSGASEIQAKLANAEQQKSAVRDGVELEVTQAYQGVKEADFALGSSKQQLASAEEAYRVARELFINGRATSTTLTDAETELTRARLEQLNARVDARTARVRLEHALGRDARTFDR